MWATLQYIIIKNIVRKGTQQPVASQNDGGLGHIDTRGPFTTKPVTLMSV